ncbi:hypothetical protein T439DRAFT_326872 [Meredithblackwellia eburnea MCA 4105]
MDTEMLAELDNIQSQPSPSPVPVSNPNSRLLDLVFILDCTGSMGSYIASATKNIELIVENILQSSHLTHPSSLRIGLICYRDYPPQDNSYITNSYEFTSDVGEVKENLKKQYASGGGDGPEAVTAAMKATLELGWRPNASRMAVLIADAPAHGIGEYGDGFANGGPDGEDPILLARQMAAQGITLFVVACEPALSGYQYGLDFFRALTVLTSGTLVPLTTASLLSHVIVGSALEKMDMERIIEEVGLAVAERVHAGMESVDEVAAELHRKLLLRNEGGRSLHVENIHRDSEEARHNVNVFTTVAQLQDAKSQLKKVPGSRFTDKYLATRYNSSYARTVPSYYSSSSPPVPPRGGTPGSPPRKVVSDFKAFSSKPSLSMADTPLGSELPEEEALAQSVELRFGNISLDQAKRITIAAAWRTAPPRA